LISLSSTLSVPVLLSIPSIHLLGSNFVVVVVVVVDVFMKFR